MSVASDGDSNLHVRSPEQQLELFELPEGYQVNLFASEVMDIWEEMEAREMVLSIDLVAGDVQVPEMKSVLKAFPKLKVAIGHFEMVTQGNWMAQIRLARHENVYIDCGGMVWLFRNEGPPFRKAQSKMKQAARAIGAEKIMWGSDYPRTMVDFTYRQSLDWMRDRCESLSIAEKNAILGDNAARLHGFKFRKRNLQRKTCITEW